MVLVRQLDREGCVIACLAMVTGHTYYNMRKKLDELKHLLPRWGSPDFELKFKPKEIRTVLKSFKIDTTYLKWDEKNGTCILLVTPVKNPEYTHALVHIQGSVIGEIRDPMIYGPLTLSHLDHYNIHSCIGIDDTSDNSRIQKII